MAVSSFVVAAQIRACLSIQPRLSSANWGTVCSQRSKWRCPVSLWLLKDVPASQFHRDCPQPTGEQCAASAVSGGVQFRCGCSKTCLPLDSTETVLSQLGNSVQPARQVAVSSFVVAAQRRASMLWPKLLFFSAR